ncbi:hypothetical protein L3V83_14940 [Thiotrichales bacterium 19X7-9]|nr:hypothetical protein [Thiotrichales bacterium 19X7-9]
MDYTKELAYWQAELEKAHTSLSKRSGFAHIDNYEQNGTNMQYSEIEKLRVHLSYCQRQVNYFQKKVDGKNTSILGKGVFIR